MNQLPLTPRERQVAILITRGLMHKEIAGFLNVAIQTVNKHQTSIYIKAGVNHKMNLARWAIRNNLLTVEQWLAPDLPKDWASL